jgi:hypothetical protein
VSSGPEQFSLSALVAGHKRATAAIVVVVVAMIALTVVPALAGTSSSALSDSATCSQWTTAPSKQQTAYGHLYLQEHRVAPDTDVDADAVTRAISKACVQAAYLGEADDVSLVAAFRHEF